MIMKNGLGDEVPSLKGEERESAQNNATSQKISPQNLLQNGYPNAVGFAFVILL